MTAVNTWAHGSTAISTLVLLLKFYGTVLIQGGVRFKSGSRPPEDGIKLVKLANSLKAVGVKQSFGISNSDDSSNDKAKMADARWQRIVMNDLENIPIGLIVAWTSLLSCYSPALHAVLVAVFALARVAHTVFYAAELQPHRANAWMLSVGCSLAMCLNGVVGLMWG